MRLLLFSIELFFAMSLCSPASAFEAPASLPEREVERPQKRARLVIGLGRGANHHVEPPDLIDLVVVDLGEDDVLLDAEREIAAPVEALGIEAAEVAGARQRHRDQAVDELEHLRLTQGDPGPDRPRLP